MTILTPSLGPSVRPSGETTGCGYAPTGGRDRSGRSRPRPVSIGPAGLSGGKDDASMRPSRAWLAAVPALAIALTGGPAVAAPPPPAPPAPKTPARNPPPR